MSYYPCYWPDGKLERDDVQKDEDDYGYLEDHQVIACQETEHQGEEQLAHAASDVAIEQQSFSVDQLVKGTCQNCASCTQRPARRRC
jgi:hypothetical protein